MWESSLKCLLSVTRWNLCKKPLWLFACVDNVTTTNCVHNDTKLAIWNLLQTHPSKQSFQISRSSVVYYFSDWKYLGLVFQVHHSTFLKIWSKVSCNKVVFVGKKKILKKTTWNSISTFGLYVNIWNQMFTCVLCEAELLLRVIHVFCGTIIKRRNQKQFHVELQKLY